MGIMKCFGSMENDHIVIKVNEPQICKINDIYRYEKTGLLFFLKKRLTTLEGF